MNIIDKKLRSNHVLTFSYILWNKRVNLDILHSAYDLYLGLSTFFLTHNSCFTKSKHNNLKLMDTVRCGS